MAIDPKLYKKYTGKMPGEAMTRMGESLARQSGREPADRLSFLGAVGRGRRRVAVIGGLIVAAAVIWVLVTGGI